MRKYKVGSLFAGIGGFELGIERAIKGAETIWQVEQNKYCQSILKKHWPNATIYDDVRNITKHNVEPVDILIGGFPCQSISIAGKLEGLENEKKSGLWWEFHRIIRELSEGQKKPIVVLENVPNVLRLGGRDILGALAEIGYDAEWTTIRASDFGACHKRERWFCVAYPDERRKKRPICTRRKGSTLQATRNKKQKNNYWEENEAESPLCSMDDGISRRLARLKALGNAIVPQCSEYIGHCIFQSGLLDEL